ncbi:MAG: right-handed parallel beta-helix repeat-containing protein [Crocinitomicaceae bacterium]|nr:right-handed parallel beta-helix repeat-containing protein [Crocinitomicaceae bacterium]
MRKLLFLLLIFFTASANAKLIKVTSTADSGSGTLREAVDVHLTNGDSILIDVKGDIKLQSRILINGFSNITLLGPSPKHSTIMPLDGGYTDASLITITNCSDVFIRNCGFAGETGLSMTMLEITANAGETYIDRCLFQSNESVSYGGAIYAVGANVQIRSCSFISNQGTNGGAVYLSNTISLIENCTFFDNNASIGGAIYAYQNTALNLSYNTIYQNNATTADAIYSNAATNTIHFVNNAISENGGAGDYQVTGSGGFTSGGGNCHRQNSGGEVVPYASGGDQFSPTLFFGLRTSEVIDGYGMIYFTIVNSGSVLIDVGGPALPGVDMRGAPRSLDGDNDFTPQADAGACEYTPLRVTTTASTSGTPNSLPWALDPAQNLNAVNYVEFDLPSIPISISPTSDMFLSGNYIIDGYSQDSTAVPGPATEGASGVTPAYIAVEITNSGANATGITVNPVSSECLISGLRITGFNSYGLDLGGQNTKVEGCEIGITDADVGAQNKSAGIRVTNNSNIIGGGMHWSRNVISGNGVTGTLKTNIYLSGGCGGNIILGNIIGARADGNAGFTGTTCLYGIYNASSSAIIGDIGRGNLISKHTEGIRCHGSSNTYIYSNKIGTDYDGMIALSNNSGIIVANGASNTVIGKPETGGGNLISGNLSTQISINQSNSTFIEHNILGLDTTGNAAILTTSQGIYIGHALADNVTIGGSTPQHGNVISGNQYGINIASAGFNCNIQNNIIGLNRDGDAPLGNSLKGIFVQGGATDPVHIGSAGAGNVISGHSNASAKGIDIQNSSNHIIQGNIIGLDKTGTFAIPNQDGIYLTGSNSVTIGGSYLANEGNVISGNTLSGITMVSGSDGNFVRGNLIGTTADGLSAMGNGLYGIYVGQTTNTSIGDGPNFRNVISGQSNSNAYGIYLGNTGSNTIINSNFIGSDINGTAPIGNYTGIQITDSHTAYIGGVPAQRNYIVASTNVGVVFDSPSASILSGNYIGIGVGSASASMGNTTGVLVIEPNADIGGVDVNVIANNKGQGILISGDATDFVVVTNCIVGTDESYTSGIGNVLEGIVISQADYCEVSSCTVIGNGGAGIKLYNSANYNLIQGNNMYDLGGTGLTNLNGIHLQTGCSQNQIGGLFSSPESNTIGNSQNYGVYVENSDDNEIYGNLIGCDIADAPFPNSYGVYIQDSDLTLIGDQAGKMNVISGNTNSGIRLVNASSTTIRSNMIGVNETGNGPVQNQIGIEVTSGSLNTVIGGSNNTAWANTISTNSYCGIYIAEEGTTVQGNYIGSTAGVLGPMFNQQYGIVLAAGAENSLIGGDRPIEGNYITCNSVAGILIEDGNNDILGNIFGVNTSFSPLGSQLVAIEISGADAANNQIGDNSIGVPQYGNIIMNQTQSGIKIHNGANNTIISANHIGLDPSNNTSFTQPIGIEILGTAGIDNQIGEAVIGGENRISGNVVGIKLDGAVHTFIYNNRIGTADDGVGVLSNAQHGIYLSDASFNTIGGTGLESNVISGNAVNGIFIEGVLSTDNIISGNIIGAGLGLVTANANGVGIKIAGGASNNYIGEVGFGLGNKILGNDQAGIVVDASVSNYFYNNRIGLQFSNTHGIVLQNGAENNIIGGVVAQRNIISGNDSIGIAIINSENNQILGNFIGLSEPGNTAVPNLIGVYFSGATFNTIGNNLNRNIISCNLAAGIIFDQASDNNTVKNNYIGTDSTGNNYFAGASNGIGIIVKYSSSNMIGGNRTIDEHNVISNNANQGIYLEGASSNEIYGNHIGIGSVGDIFIPNGQEGILLRLGSNLNLIGSSGSGLMNSISGNAKGIFIKNSDDNIIQSNYIGTDLDGGNALVGSQNQAIGIHLDSASTGNEISELNVISGNLDKGIFINSAGTNSNAVLGNYIGVDITGNAVLTNQIGISISNGASLNNIGGGLVSDRNIISGNVGSQIVCSGAGTNDNSILGNYIGIGTDGGTSIGGNVGITLDNNAGTTYIGNSGAGEGNIIANMTLHGIVVDNNANNSIIKSNRIGIDASNFSAACLGSGIYINNSQNTIIGGVGLDEGNEIANCNTGVMIGQVINSSGNQILGNLIHDNTFQGIDLDGDNAVLANDGSMVTGNNDEIDFPEIFSAFDCGGTTHVGFRTEVPPGTYIVEIFSNTSPDATNGEGEIFLGRTTISPVFVGDSADIDLGSFVAPGTSITATITGLTGTSEFGTNFIVNSAPSFPVYAISDETCLGAADGIITVSAPVAYMFSLDGNPSVFGNAAYTFNANSGIHEVKIYYPNGCIDSTDITINAGTPLSFAYTAAADTCLSSLGSIDITSVLGSPGPFNYSFDGGFTYSATPGIINIAAGNYTVIVQDQLLGCTSLLTTVSVVALTDIEDESFVFDDFCALTDIALPTSVATAGGVFSFETVPSDGAVINAATGEITGFVLGNSYSVIYTIGQCSEKDTINVNALDNDDPTFSMDDFCDGSPQNIVISGLSGGTFSFNPDPADGAVINSATGEISGIGGTTYTVQYLTNGACPDSSTVMVTVLYKPAAPQIIVTDSVYCPGDIFSALSVATGTSIANWMLGSSSSTVLSTDASFTPTILSSGDNYIYVVLLDGSTCASDADSVNYYLSDISSMTAGYDVQTCLGSLIQLNASGANTYQWSDNPNLSETDIADPTAEIDDADFYVVTLTDVYGCVKSDTVSVTLLPLEDCHVETYNSFSPNDDGKNDFWEIDGIEGYPENTVIIFNRWGDKMIEFENYNNQTVIWDGSNKSGNPVPAGTYYYVVNVNGDQNQSGWVQVTR